jgi:hypothetical protein
MTDAVAAGRAAETPDSTEWLRANWVTVAAVLGLALELWWRASMLAHSYFQQSDFQHLDQAAGNKLGVTYLLTPSDGQLSPGALAIAWLEGKAGLYNWGVASAVSVLMLALAGLALLHLLRRLFGNRPAILAPYTLYLVTPLVVPVLTWWSATFAWLPLQIGTFMAINSHVSYVRTGRFRHAIAATFWLAVGVLFAEKGVLTPLVLLALTAAFLLPGRWASSLLAALRRYWRGWLLYAVVMAAYIVVAVVKIGGSGFSPRPMAAGSALSFASSVVRVGLVPGVLGGPWKWWTTGSYAVAAQTPVLTAVSWLVAAVAVLASVWFRRRAWRAWLIIVGWLVVADLLPVWVGWISALRTPVFTADLSYLADAVPVIVIFGALAFWPAQDEENPYRNRLPSGATRTLITLNAVGVILVGSVWSAHAYQNSTSDQAARSYIATARLALRQAPAGANVVSAPVPTGVMSHAFFGDASNTEAVLGPLAPIARHIRWTTAPQGAVHDLMIFDSAGRLWPAIVIGDSAVAPTGKAACWRLGARALRLQLQHAAYRWPWFAEFGYSGPATTVGLNFSGGWQTVGLADGHHDTVVALPGAGKSVTVRNLGLARAGCLTYLAVGTLQPSVFGFPVPSEPVSG